jgi:uncharacterized membrane protein
MAKQASGQTDHSRESGSELRSDAYKQIFQDQDIRKRPPSVTIGKPLEEVYEFFRDFSHLPKFMKGVKEVSSISKKAYRWVFEGETTEEWNVELIAERANEMIAWRKIGETAADSTGAAIFERATGGRGTIVSLKVPHESLLEKLEGSAAKTVGKNPNLRAAVDLRRLKAYLETGEVPTIEGQPNGKETKAVN